VVAKYYSANLQHAVKIAAKAHELSMLTLFLASLLLFGCLVDVTNVVGVPTGADMYAFVCL
jgi:hypothetical protein